jgi:urease subunit beta
LAVIPGEFILLAEDIVCNAGRKTATVFVVNTGDRPVQVGSHFHFFEANSALAFDREKAFGMRLNIPAGSAVRFEPGDGKEVELVALAGRRCVYGLNRRTEGGVDA